MQEMGFIHMKLRDTTMHQNSNYVNQNASFANLSAQFNNASHKFSRSMIQPLNISNS